MTNPASLDYGAFARPPVRVHEYPGQRYMLTGADGSGCWTNAEQRVLLYDLNTVEAILAHHGYRLDRETHQVAPVEPPTPEPTPEPKPTPEPTPKPKPKPTPEPVQTDSDAALATDPIQAEIDAALAALDVAEQAAVPPVEPPQPAPASSSPEALPVSPPKRGRKPRAAR